VTAVNRVVDKRQPTPLRAQSALDRFTNAAYDLVIEGET
jgi:hypothetical protein